MRNAKYSFGKLALFFLMIFAAFFALNSQPFYRGDEKSHNNDGNRISSVQLMCRSCGLENLLRDEVQNSKG